MFADAAPICPVVVLTQIDICVFTAAVIQILLTIIHLLVIAISTCPTARGRTGLLHGKEKDKKKEKDSKKTSHHIIMIYYFKP